MLQSILSQLLTNCVVQNVLQSVDTGCRFLLRAVDVETTNSATAAMTGMMEKRGGGKGGAKSWKARYDTMAMILINICICSYLASLITFRHFRIEENGLVYYKTEPISKKQLASPLGTWSITGWTIFLVKGQVCLHLM